MSAGSNPACPSLRSTEIELVTEIGSSKLDPYKQ